MKERTYLCIDLKSFYASVECCERGLDPMTTNLVVADPERTSKTICLAVSPSLKKLGVHNRCRVFEIPDEFDYIMAEPQMQKYIDYSARIYGIYLRHFSKDDIYVYSIDESFIDITSYLSIYRKTPKEMAVYLMDLITTEVGVRATAGIGTNLYLTKVALDITAKHAEDFIGILDEEKFKATLWNHRPLTDFWRIGKGIENHLNRLGIYTMGQIAWADEEMMYREFGIDAELMIDHAWGREPVTISDIKAYKPKTNSISSGQVLARDYVFSEGEVIVKEMVDLLALELVEKNLVTSNISVYIRYSNKEDVPSAGGSINLDMDTNNDKLLINAAVKLYRRIANRGYKIRGFNISCNNTREDTGFSYRQTNLFEPVEDIDLEKEKKAQKAINDIKKRYGKNAILKGMNFEKGATTIERNRQIGGHKSGKKA